MQNDLVVLELHVLEVARFEFVLNFECFAPQYQQILVSNYEKLAGFELIQGAPTHIVIFRTIEPDLFVPLCYYWVVSADLSVRTIKRPWIVSSSPELLGLFVEDFGCILYAFSSFRCCIDDS